MGKMTVYVYCGQRPLRSTLLLATFLLKAELERRYRPAITQGISPFILHPLCSLGTLRERSMYFRQRMVLTNGDFDLITDFESIVKRYDGWN